jgi:hypothetical protein
MVKNEGVCVCVFQNVLKTFASPLLQQPLKFPELIAAVNKFAPNRQYGSRNEEFGV